MGTDQELNENIAKLMLLKNFITLTDSRLNECCKKIRTLKMKMTGFSRPIEYDEEEFNKLNLDAFHYVSLLCIHLFSLKDSHDKFLTKIPNNEIQQLMKLLEPAFLPIKNNFALIADSRNTVFAHGWIQGDSFRGMSDVLKNHNMSMQEFVERIFFLSKCTTIFLDGLLSNMVSQKPFAFEILKNSMNSLNTKVDDAYVNANYNAKKILEDTQKSLKNNLKNWDISFVDDVKNWKISLK